MKAISNPKLLEMVRFLSNCFKLYDDTSLNPIVRRKNTFCQERDFLFMCVFAGIKPSLVCWPSIFFFFFL